jgi:hypothetical protein
MSGIAVCGVCQAKCKTSATRGARGSSRKVYVCSQGEHVWRSVKAVDHVAVSTVLIRLEAMAPEQRMALLAPDTDSALAGDAAQLRAQIAKLTDLYMDPESFMTKPYYKARRASLQAQLTAVERKMGTTSRAPVLNEFMSSSDIRKAWEGAPFDRQRSMLDAPIAVTIHPGATLNGTGPVNMQTAGLSIKWRIGPATEDEWTKLVGA